MTLQIILLISFLGPLAAVNHPLCVVHWFYLQFPIQAALVVFVGDLVLVF
jgi:hypothetical protein